LVTFSIKRAEADEVVLFYSVSVCVVLQPSVGRVINQVDIVPTTALVLGLPIPFSNLGTAIPEVFLPYNKKPDSGNSQDGGSNSQDGGGNSQDGGGNSQDGGAKEKASSAKEQDKISGSVSNGFGGRVTLDFLKALRANAEQLHTYLVTYARYSDDFPAEGRGGARMPAPIFPLSRD